MADNGVQQSERVVSFDDEPLILVDANDEVVGHTDKVSAHRGQGVLHRAFSLFVFRSDGRLIMQQRAAGKRLWPGFWSNTCCSHPRRGETIETAVHRRLEEELGLRCALEFLYRFQYQAQYDADGAENELCSVFAGISDAAVRVNATEVAAVDEITPQALDRRMRDTPERFTPWFHLEWQRIRTEHNRWLSGENSTPNSA